ncbi:MAG: DNA polymerase III subunit chi [Rhizobiaceae bacterium]
MTEVLFYHLTQNSFLQALPALLEKCLERDWRVTVQVEDPAQRDELNEHLWTYRDDSFLPHGAEGSAGSSAASAAGQQPVWITTTTENPNNSNVRFSVGTSVPAGTADYKRMIYMFDGHDLEAVSAARERWKIEKKAGHELTYWQQDEDGRWRKAA